MLNHNDLPEIKKDVGILHELMQDVDSDVWHIGEELDEQTEPNLDSLTEVLGRIISKSKSLLAYVKEIARVQP